MRTLGVTRLGLVAGAVFAAALLVFGVGGAFATDFQVLVGKGCVSPVYVGDPYQCHSNLKNADLAGDSYVIQSLSDKVNSSGGAVVADLFASHTPLVFHTNDGSGPVTCTNPASGSGSGSSNADPFLPTATTKCTLPGDTSGGQNGGSITVGAPNFSHYSVLAGDFTANAAHTLSDQVTYTITDACDVSTSNCDSEILNPENASAAATVMKRGSAASTTILNAAGAPVTTVAIGTTVHDSGSVVENTVPPPIVPGPVPTGTVSITFFQGGSCDGTVLDTGTATLDANGNFNATGMPETLTAAGQYSFQATYNGDGFYNASPPAACEPLTVTPATPTITTLLSATTVNDGTAVHDSATLHGATSDAGGTVTYSVYGDSDCEGQVADGGTVDVTDGSVPNSNDVTLTTPGTYYWRASYSGDANNEPATSGCTEEPLVVAPLVDLTVTKAGAPADQELTSSSTITWTMVVTNNGPDTDTGVKIVDPMPAGNTYVSSQISQGSCTGGPILNCTIGTMTAGQSVTITLVTKPTTVGQQVNTVTVSGDKPETNTTNNQATATVLTHQLTPPPPTFCVAVSKVTPKQLYVGRKTKVTIHVSKHGKAVRGIHVRIKGPKINIRTKASNAKGVITLTVTMKKAGILVFSPIASKRCNTQRVGVTNVFTPPVTG